MYRYIIECKDNSKITIHTAKWLLISDLIGENKIDLDNSKIHLFSTIKNVIHLP